MVKIPTGTRFSWKRYTYAFCKYLTTVTGHGVIAREAGDTRTEIASRELVCFCFSIADRRAKGDLA